MSRAGSYAKTERPVGTLCDGAAAAAAAAEKIQLTAPKKRTKQEKRKEIKGKREKIIAAATFFFCFVTFRFPTSDQRLADEPWRGARHFEHRVNRLNAWSTEPLAEGGVRGDVVL